MKSMKKRIEVIMAVLLLAGACLFAKEGTRMVENLKAKKGEVCIVIDAGHGGGNQRQSVSSLSLGACLCQAGIRV